MLSSGKLTANCERKRDADAKTDRQLKKAVEIKRGYLFYRVVF